MTGWHPDPDQLVALALADVEGHEQEQLLAHLTTCASCRDDYAQLCDGLQQTLTAAVSIAPPAGFSGRVLSAMSIGTETAAPSRPQHWRLMLVACVLAGLLVGVGGALGINAWLNRSAPTYTASASSATSLLTADGATVGSVGITQRDGNPYLLLNITAGREGARYDCILVQPDGSRVSGGSWALTKNENGPGAASGSWLVPISGSAPTAVELVATSGAIWAQGKF